MLDVSLGVKLQKPLKIGSLTLESPFFLSPLAGYTNLPFRRLIRQIGGVGLCTTDLVNARSLIENNKKALKLVETHPEDQPLAVQIFGGKADELSEAAKMLQDKGVASIDINMGCPVPKVCNVGAGSALLKDCRASAQLVKHVVRGLHIPLTCKIRLGWDSKNITAPELAQSLRDAGAAAIFVHGRTREQGFSGTVNLEAIAAVVDAVPEIPVIGNGDVVDCQSAYKMARDTGCAGISVGRGAFYNPWIFRQLVSYFFCGTPHPAEPDFETRVSIMRKHLDLLIEFFGEHEGCVRFRKIGPWYVKKLGPASEFNRRITQLTKKEQFEEIIIFFREWRAQFFEADGKTLRPRYRCADSGRAEQPAVAEREQIPVPAGPVEFW